MTTEPRKLGLGRGKGRLTDSPDGRHKVKRSIVLPPDVNDALEAAAGGVRGAANRIVADALRAHLLGE